NISIANWLECDIRVSLLMV
ncbi:hypothetical protein NPIL_222001, partial [Nephila pilipes]